MLSPVLGTCLVSITILFIIFNPFSGSLRTRLPNLHATHPPPLRLNTHNEFHISIFSDLHYGEEENGWGIDQDVKSTHVINTILDHETPDLVIISTQTNSASKILR